MLVLLLLLALAAGDDPGASALGTPRAEEPIARERAQSGEATARGEDEEVVRNLDLLEKLDLAEALELLDEDGDANPPKGDARK